MLADVVLGEGSRRFGKSRERTEHSRTVCTASTERDGDEAKMTRSERWNLA